MSSAAIDEIEDRLQDLTDALREAQSLDFAQRLEEHALDFTEPKRVRRSVNMLRMQLEDFRQTGSGLPETPKVTLAANRLEDACREALAAGVIVAAAPSLAVQARRKLAVVLVTVLCGGMALLIPIALVKSGVDFNDIGKERVLGSVRVPRGEEDDLRISALAAALMPQAVKGAAFEPLNGCRQSMPDGSTCAQVPPRLWAEGRLPTYELKLKHQAYGLLFAFVDAKVDAGVAEGRLLIAATDDTPEGTYELRFSATYTGYTPQRCELLERWQGACPPPRAGADERHSGIAMPLVRATVVPGDPNKRLGEKRREQAEADEARRKAEERAAQIESAVSAIGDALKQSETLVARKRWPEAKQLLHKLGSLFQPLDGLVLEGAGADVVPPAVSEVRARYDVLHEQLEAFERRVFDQTFALVTADANRLVPEDRLLERIAKQFRVPAAYVQEIYTDRADEIQKRLDARAQARLDGLKADQQERERRCGPLPTRAWDTVSRYLRDRLAETRVELALGECMTPRLSERECWELRCDYQRKVEVAVERPKVVTHHSATFYIRNDHVTRMQ